MGNACIKCNKMLISNNLLFQVLNFITSKCQSAHAFKKNPREVCWTVLYRRKHKKGHLEEVTKRRVRRTKKFARSVAGASLAEITAKRNQKPEVRKALREQAIR